jgi:uncharacterized protein YecE (DUF72 family)
VPEQITVTRWPAHARYGVRAGEWNESFLDASLFTGAFAELLSPHKQHVGVMMFEFGTMSKRECPSVDWFADRLDRFLEALPEGWRYAVEVRNEEFLCPKYFDTLAKHNVAHVFNAWTRMPTVAEQTALPDAFTADFTVVRALLQKGRPYEEAVSMFQPYREVQEADPATRNALREIVERTLKAHQRAYIFVNNRLEGHAPGTIDEVVRQWDSSPKR